MNAYRYLVFLVIGLVCIIPVVSADYDIQVEALTNTPADAVTNYLGNRPAAPSTVAGLNPVYFPTAGTVTDVEIYDYSGTAGSNQAYVYYLRINNDTDYLIKSLSVSANERVFTNSSIGVSVNAGDYFEIKRVHPTWNPNPATNIVGGYVHVNTSTHGYTLWGHHLTVTPGDNANNYFGGRPIASSTTAMNNKLSVPSPGNITRVDIQEYSGTASTNEEYGYFIERNGGARTAIQNQSVASKQRLFNATGLALQVMVGDFIEYRRMNPNWTTNPATTIVGANAFVDTTGSPDPSGYPVWVQALTSTPGDGATAYFGNRPIAPSTTAGTNKIYIRDTGTIKKAEIYYYSGTAGTTEPWSLYVTVNGATDYLIDTVAISSAERFFKNMDMDIPVSSGDYIEIKSVQPTWVTNPATSIAGGYLWFEDGTVSACAGDIVLPPVADFSANRTPAQKPAAIQFFDQSNNTIPGTTSYYWNFTDGGTTVDSTDINPNFTYTNNGTFTINHTIKNGATVSTKTKTIEILGGIGSSAPVASFSLVLTDNSTQYPTSWVWNITNLLGDNVETTYSTEQNPVLDLGTGNWRINLTATNAIGSGTTSKTIGWNLSSPRVYFWNRTA